MEGLLLSPGFWAFLGTLFTPILLGIGWVVRRLLNRKDEQAKKLDALVVRNREEAEELNRRILERTEQTMELKAERTYLTRMLESCEKERDRLRSGGARA